MGMLDVFSSSAFTMSELSAAVNKLPFAAGKLGAMKLFQPRPVSTTKIMLEEKGGKITILPTKARGAPPNIYADGLRKMREFQLPHLPYESTINAASLQDVRQFGSESALRTAMEAVLDASEAMRRDIEVTIEKMRTGAMQGKILDADGSTLVDLFTEFGVVQQTASLELGSPESTIRTACLAAKRKVEDELGNLGYTGMTAICGEDFFDGIIDHADVRKTFSGYQDSEMLRSDPRGGFPFAGIRFIEYRGKDESGTPFIPDDEAYLFPEGVPGLFIEHYGPADFLDSINTPGMAVYAKVAFDPQFGRWVKVHLQANPLPIVTQPRAVVKLTMT